MKEESIILTIIQWLGAIVLIGLLLFVVDYSKDNFVQYKEYKVFCDNRPNFCYCNWGTCEYKLVNIQKCLNDECTMTDNSDFKALCILAERLEDKKTIFKAGCN